MKGLEKLKIYTVVSLVIMMLFLIPGTIASLKIEYLFPGHLIYYIWNYEIKYPDSNPLRKAVVVFFLAFGELVLSLLLCKIPIKSYCLQFLIQYLLIYLLFLIMPTYSNKYLNNNEIRVIVYLNESFWRALLIVGVIRNQINIAGISQSSLFESAIFGILLSLTPSTIYYLDYILCISPPKKDISINGIIVQIKHGLLLSVICYISFVINNSHVQSSLFFDYLRDKLAIQTIGIYLNLWYSLEAINYNSSN